MEKHLEAIYEDVLTKVKKPSKFERKPEKKEPAPLSLKEKRELKVIRKAGGEQWVDKSLADWPEDDFRIYCCNLGNEVTEAVLENAFTKYKSFARCKVVRDKKTEKSKGFAFVSILEKADYVRAMKELDGKYVGNRPIKLKPSKWTDKSLAKGFGELNSKNQANAIEGAKR